MNRVLFGSSQEQWSSARNSVRRLFTYGTPHNGITVQGGIGNMLLRADQFACSASNCRISSATG